MNKNTHTVVYGLEIYYHNVYIFIIIFFSVNIIFNKPNAFHVNVASSGHTGEPNTVWASRLGRRRGVVGRRTAVGMRLKTD